MATRKLLTFFQDNFYSLAVIFLAGLTRLIPHPPNVAPIAAIALFSGAYLDKKIAFTIPLAAMFLSDIFLGFHPTMIYVYSSFALTVFLGLRLKKNKKISCLLQTSIVSSVLFFLITNFGAWATSGMYPKNTNGLFQAYLMGLPFFRNTLFGDLFYTLIIFYGYKYLTTLAKKCLQRINLRKTNEV